MNHDDVTRIIWDGARRLNELTPGATKEPPKEQILIKQNVAMLTIGLTANEEELVEFLGKETDFEITYRFLNGAKTVNEIVLSRYRIKIRPGQTVLRLADGSLAVTHQ